MLSPRLLDLLRDWYRIARPAIWLFPGRDPMLPMTTRQFNRAVQAGDAAHIAAQFCHPPARAEYRCSPDSSLARPCQGRHDGALHTGHHQRDPRGHEPARSSHAAGPSRRPKARVRVVRPALEVADIFRGHGPVWRQANAGHVSLSQLKVMSAIERCRTAALGGHVAPASTASATTACSPRPPMPTTSRGARELLAGPKPQREPADADVTGRPLDLPSMLRRPHDHHRVARNCPPHYQPSTTTVATRIDTS
jgi:hypothetical protein